MPRLASHLSGSMSGLTVYSGVWKSSSVESRLPVSILHRLATATSFGCGPVLRLVVVLGQHPGGLPVRRGLLPLAVAPQDVRVVAVDQLAHLRQHVVADVVLHRRRTRVRHRRTGVRVGHRPAGVRRVVPLVERVVEAGLELAVLPCRVEQVTGQVTLRAEVDRVAAADLAVPQRHALVVLRGQHEVLRTGVVEQLHPFLRVVLLRLPLADERVVRRVLAVGVPVVVVRRRVPLVHVVPVPLGVRAARAPGGHRVRTPVDEDAELRVVEPLRHRVRVQRLRRRLVVGRVVAFSKRFAGGRAG